MNPADYPDLIPAKEVAAMLGVTTGTVTRLAQGNHYQGLKLDRIRIGRHYLYSRVAVEKIGPKLRRGHAAAKAITPTAPAESTVTVTQADRVDEMRAAILAELRHLRAEMRHLRTMVDAIAVQTDWNTAAFRQIGRDLGITL